MWDHFKFANFIICLLPAGPWQPLDQSAYSGGDDRFYDGEQVGFILLVNKYYFASSVNMRLLCCSMFDSEYVFLIVCKTTHIFWYSLMFYNKMHVILFIV